MAHVIGTVNNLPDLVTAIFSALTSNGWTLDTDVISRGGVFVRIRVVSGTVEFLAGTGVDGSDAITGAAPQMVRIRPLAQAFVFPMTYELHINTAPDEVYVVVNYAVDFYQWAWFGRSNVAGLPGTGVYCTANCNASTPTGITLNPVGANSPGNGVQCCIPFGPSSIGGQSGSQNGFIQHGLDSETWNTAAITLGASPTHANLTLATEQLGLLPNTWNDEMVLLPIMVWRARPSNKVSLVVDLANARWCRIDYHDPGDIIEFGGTEWKIYPFYRKDVTARDGSGNPAIQHTGTMGFAVRYTGS